MRKALLFLLILLLAAVGCAYSRPGQYTYYLHVPPNSDICYLWGVGWFDGTKVEVYELKPDGEEALLTSAVLNRMEVKKLYTFSSRESDGWFIKVVASKRLGVLLDDRDATSTLYPSYNGTFTGKEFIIYGVIPSSLRPTGSLIYAYEDAKVTIYDDKGKKIQEFALIQNRSKILKSIGLPGPWHIVSTGRILCGTWSENSFAFLVDERGRFIGRHFAGIVNGGSGFQTVVVIIPYEPALVRVYDAISNKLIAEKKLTEADVAVNNHWYLMFNRSEPIALRIVSTGDISVMCGSPEAGVGPEALNTPLGDDFSVMGIQANVETRIFMSHVNSSSYTILFAKEPASVTIDGFYRINIGADGYVILTNREGLADNFPSLSGAGKVLNIGPRVHVIVSDKPVMLLLYQIGGDWNDWGNYAVAFEDVGIDLGPPRPSKGFEEAGGGADYTMYIGAGAAAAVIVVLLLLLKHRKRSA